MNRESLLKATKVKGMVAVFYGEFRGPRNHPKAGLLSLGLTSRNELIEIPLPSSGGAKRLTLGAVENNSPFRKTLAKAPTIASCRAHMRAIPGFDKPGNDHFRVQVTSHLFNDTLKSLGVSGKGALTVSLRGNKRWLHVAVTSTAPGAPLLLMTLPASVMPATVYASFWGATLKYFGIVVAMLAFSTALYAIGLAVGAGGFAVGGSIAATIAAAPMACLVAVLALLALIVLLLLLLNEALAAAPGGAASNPAIAAKLKNAQKAVGDLMERMKQKLASGTPPTEQDVKDANKALDELRALENESKAAGIIDDDEHHTMEKHVDDAEQGMKKAGLR